MDVAVTTPFNPNKPLIILSRQSFHHSNGKFIDQTKNDVT